MPMNDVQITIDGRTKQVATIVWRRTDGRLEVLLITSRDTGRWVVPKGWPKSGKPLWKSAAEEVWEEAGVEGAITDAPIGTYDYDKSEDDGDDRPFTADVFVMECINQVDEFPEAAVRQRFWTTPDSAADLLDERGLRALIRRFADMVPGAPHR
jgi:8-oxo-dGTP pyrophosphatase MutT (NUDIX family)